MIIAKFLLCLFTWAMLTNAIYETTVIAATSRQRLYNYYTPGMGYQSRFVKH